MSAVAASSVGFTKIDLFCRGLRLGDPELAQLAEDGGTGIRRTRAGLGSGLELVLPGGVRVNVPVVEPFTRHSPYTLRRLERGRYALVRDGTEVVPVTLTSRPAWYGLTTRGGRTMDRIGTLQGTYLAIYQSRVCDFWRDRERQQNCGFCSVGLNLGVDDALEKTTDEILEVVHAARAESRITYVDFNTGHLDGERYLDLLEPALARIKRETGILVGVQCPPHSDLTRYDRLRAMGVNRVSFCLEVFDAASFRELCPGKSETYGRERYLEAIRYCAQLGARGPRTEPWVTNGEIIAGLEPVESTIRCIDWLTGVGAIPTVCVFRPLVGTRLAGREPPRTEDVIPIYRRLFEACMERGLPIGAAPNIRVSIVPLPEECADLSERRFPLKRAKIRALRGLLGWKLGRAGLHNSPVEMNTHRQ